MIWTIVVPLELVSANQHLVNGGGRRAAIAGGARYRKARDTWTRALVVLARNAEIPKAVGLRRIVLTRIIAPRQRAFDYGNLVGGAKHVLDACKAAGLLVDDAPKWCIDVYEQRKPYGDEPQLGTIITIEDVETQSLAPAAAPGGIVSAALRREPGWARRVSSALQPADVGDAEPGSVGAELAGRGRAARAHRCAEAQGDAGLAQVGVGAGARIGDRSQILRAGQQEEEDGQDANAAHDRQRGANLRARQGRAARRKNI